MKIDLDELKKCIEKATPKKAVIDEISENCRDYFCPVCDFSLSPSYQNYCHICGQLIDFGDWWKKK